MTSNRSKLLRDDVYTRLKRAVLTCELAPGTFVREQELAAQFGVSKSPVRDALHRLETEGFVEVLPRKGYRVAAISLEDALELYEMRFILESASVERAARTASQADLLSLDSFRPGPPTRVAREWIDHNRRFHLAIATICGNNRLMFATREIVLAFDRLTSASLSELQGPPSQGGAAFEKMDQEHSEIIDAMQSRNAGRAVALMQAHIEASRSRFIANYNSPRKPAIDRSRIEVETDPTIA